LVLRISDSGTRFEGFFPGLSPAGRHAVLAVENREAAIFRLFSVMWVGMKTYPTGAIKMLSDSPGSLNTDRGFAAVVPVFHSGNH
jgi:hypothetical protein